MIKVYVPNTSNTNIGGGWTFLRNFKKALKDKVQFVDNWRDSNIVFVFGITTIDKAEIHEAVNAGKKLVLRVDNIPRKSRNRRQSPAERLAEFGGKATTVVYQSGWCKEYAGYFIDNPNNIIINNGVDVEIFNGENRANNATKNYLYINYNDNPNKRFDEALYIFEMEWRKDNNIELVIVGNVPKIYLEHPEYNWDLNVDAKVNYMGILDNPLDIAKIMKECDHLLYPSFAEAYPNTLLEAMACGVMPIGLNKTGGTAEAFCKNVTKVKTIQEMGDEYLKVFEEIINLK